MAKSTLLKNPGRKVYFFYGVNDHSDHCFASELASLSNNYPSFLLRTFYSRLHADDIKGTHYDLEGYPKMETILGYLPTHLLHYYICGPLPMMNYFRKALTSLLIPSHQIHLESFLSGGNEVVTAPASSLPSPQTTQKTIRVDFLRSGKTIQWDPKFSSLLEFAEAHEIEVSYGCRFGDCGTCLSGVKGNVLYSHPVMIPLQPNECLICSCIPAEDITLNL